MFESDRINEEFERLLAHARTRRRTDAEIERTKDLFDESGEENCCC